MIGEFRNKVNVRRHDQPIQTSGGGLIEGTVINSVFKWAKVENRSGSLGVANAQREWNYDYKITVRYSPSFIEKSSDEIIYNGKAMAIREVSFKDEGKQKFVILRCSLNE